MATSKTGTVAQYLKELAPDQRAVISAVRDVILRNLPAGYRESMNWGMISYEIPLERYSETYNGQPLSYAALAAQKNYFSLHLMGVYSDARSAGWLAKEFKKRGKKLDMGKSCVRFKTAEDLPMDVIGQVIASTPPDKFIELFEAGRRKKTPR